MVQSSNNRPGSTAPRRVGRDHTSFCLRNFPNSVFVPNSGAHAHFLKAIYYCILSIAISGKEIDVISQLRESRPVRTQLHDHYQALAYLGGHPEIYTLSNLLRSLGPVKNDALHS